MYTVTTIGAIIFGFFVIVAFVAVGKKYREKKSCAESFFAGIFCLSLFSLNSYMAGYLSNEPVRSNTLDRTSFYKVQATVQDGDKVLYILSDANNNKYYVKDSAKTLLKDSFCRLTLVGGKYQLESVPIREN